MDALVEIASFGAKLLLLLAFIAAAVALVAQGASRARTPEEPPPLKVTALNRLLEDRKRRLDVALSPPSERKRVEKRWQQQEKARKKAPSAGEARPRALVLDFHGDIRASGVDQLREEITALLQVADSRDEVIVRLESPGGMVHGYGLAASQLARIRERGIRLTVAVDKVAASGGYMMACVADRIVAAPFAIIGSIGVVLQMPNFNKLLKQKNIDFELLTAGEHKRTLTLFGENTDAARAKALEELEETHTLFKDFIRRFRPALDIDAVARGEHWFGTRALELGLVDENQTSDDYLLQKAESHDVFTVALERERPWLQRIAERFAHLRDAVALGLPRG